MGNIMYQCLYYDLLLGRPYLTQETYRILLTTSIVLTLPLDLVSFLPYVYSAAYSFAARQKSISADEVSSLQK